MSHGGLGGGICTCRFRWEKKRMVFFKCRCKDLLFNFKSILTRKGPGFSDSGMAGGGGGGGGGICLHLYHYLNTNNNDTCYYDTTSEILSGNI